MSKQQEESGFKKLPVIAVPVIFLLATIFLFAEDLHTQEPMIFIIFFAVTTFATGGFAYVLKKRVEEDGIKDAIKLAATPIEDLGVLEDNNSSSSDSSTEKTPPASEKLKNELYFERADKHCEWCGDQVDSPDVHHIQPREEGGPNKKSNLIVLCPTCHRKADRGAISRSKLKYQVRQNKSD